jgi:DNA-binding XRE family transcriptional regulator
VTAEELIQWRKEHELSQSELAELLGVHWKTECAWENGHRDPPPFLHLALAELSRQLLKRQAARRTA